MTASDESTYLGIFKLYSLLLISSLLTTLENFSTLSRFVTTSTILLMSQTRSLLFLPTLINPFEASTIKTSVFVRFFFKTIIIVGIPVPKKMLAGNPIIASIWFFSIKFLRISPSSPPRNNTPCGRTIVIIPSLFTWKRS